MAIIDRIGLISQERPDMYDFVCSGIYNASLPASSSVPKYTYPDGVPASGRPIDGQSFVMNGPFGRETYIWDDSVGVWKVVSVQTHRPAIHHIEIKLEIQGTREMKCECGSEKVGSNRHSSWCPKHSSDG